MKKIIETSLAPLPVGPYSQAVAAGDFLYISGQIALDPRTNTLIKTDIQSETQQVMKNISALLEAGKTDFEHVVKASIFLKSMNDFSVVNNVYGSYFKTAFPARETVEVSQLPKEANVEISIIAYVPPSKNQ